jgi:Domain of unknown function (DUF1707)
LVEHLTLETRDRIAPPDPSSSDYEHRPDRVRSPRISDLDRERAVAELKRHYASGRLDAGELAERTDAVLRTRTREEADAVVGDLPAPATAGPVGLRDHALAFAGVNGVLLVLSWATRDTNPGPTDIGAGYYRPFWILGIWSLLLVAHALLTRRVTRRELGSGPLAP